MTRRGASRIEEKSLRHGDRRFQLFLLLCTVAGPVAAFGHHPARRRPRALRARGVGRSLAGARRGGFHLYRRRSAGAVAAASCGGLPRRRPRRQPGRVRRRQRRRCRHAGSGRAARPRRPRHPSQRGGRPARARAAQERARAVCAALARDHHRAARGDRDHRTAPGDLSRPGAGRPLDGTDHHAGAGADAVRRHREMHADDVPRPDAAAPGRGNARRFRRQCQPRTAHAARRAVRLHRYAAGAGQGRRQGARALPRHHAYAGDADGAADRRSAVAVAGRIVGPCPARRVRRYRADHAPGRRRAGAAGRGNARSRSRSSCRRRR